LQCNRGRAPNALATFLLLIAVGILVTRKLAQYDGGKRVPATVSAIAEPLGRINIEVRAKFQGYKTLATHKAKHIPFLQACVRAVGQKYPSRIIQEVLQAESESLETELVKGTILHIQVGSGSY
jgi:hypothetical protein